MFRLSSKIFTFVCFIVLQANTVFAAHELKWNSWNSEVFAKAAKENRLVLLHMEAVWCHWCHVMEKETYENPEVQSYLDENFLLVKVDSDANPDLANRYKDYGWPATVIFDAKAKELRKLRGYVEADKMIGILKAVRSSPVPEFTEEEETFSTATSLPGSLKETLIARHFSSHDQKLGGLITRTKYIDGDSLEYDLLRAYQGEDRNRTMATRTLDNALQLIDPVWGGGYQYSTHSVWNMIHFEKIAGTQSNNLRLYSLGYQLIGDERYKKAAEDVYRYLKTFMLSPEGAFYTSQDADVVKGEHSGEYFKLNDAERRARGIPRVDTNRYSRENGVLADAVLSLYDATADVDTLNVATRAIEWVLANRAMPEGGFRHGEETGNKVYLGDSLYMGQALLHLYASTGDRAWLTRAKAAGDFIGAHFVSEDAKRPGYLTVGYLKAAGDEILQPIVVTAENIAVERFLNALSHYTGDTRYHDLAAKTVPYLASEHIALETLTEPGIIVADEELNSPPLHITIVAPKSSAEAKVLFQAARRFPAAYKRTEWWDRSEGPMPNPDVSYPQLPKPAAFICTNKRCSLPIFTPEAIASTIKTFTGAGKKKPL